MSTLTKVINYEYLNQRLQELGITDAMNTFKRTWYVDVVEEQDGKKVPVRTTETRDYKLFDADEHGNIVIRYFNLLGQPYRWKNEETKAGRDFTRLRLKHPEGDRKYVQAPGSPTFPYFPPSIIRKYEAKEQIHTLYLIEGEFKAFKGTLAGIDMIGLPGIHGFYNGDIKGKMNEDIQELLITCKVEKIVMVFDADLFTVKWAEGKDLAKRPNSFYGSIKSFRESLQLLMDDENVALKYCYVMSIKLKYVNECKGLDDLLVRYEDRTLEIIEDMCAFQFAKKYFDGYQINDLNKDVQGKIYKLLGLGDEQEFYKVYGDWIGAQEFKYKRRRYLYDAEAKEVKFVRHEDADKFMRIGPDWVKVISKVNKHGEKEEEIVSWKISEIQRDYKRYPDFLDQIMKYDDFCNEPNWNGSYKRVIEGCYNLCEPMKWIPKEGSIATSAAFLKHLFQGNGNIILDSEGKYESEEAIIGDQFTVALDYLSILLKHPKHMLPVPILVSQENGTGKSTFLKWLQMLWGSNMCILGNAQFQMKFNGHYITKFIIAIDEGFLEVDKKAEKERLKQLVTADSAYLENKGMNVRKINYYGKLIICSNDADRVMKIEDGESRWFVVKVPVIPKEKMDPDLESKLKEEAAAWIHFLHHRKIAHPRTHRLWFNPEHFITEQFKVIVETTKNRVDRVFEDWIQEQFLLFRLPVLRYTQKFLTEVFNDSKNSKYKIDSIELKAYLERQGLKIEVPQRHKIPIGFDLGSNNYEEDMSKKIIYRDEMGRPYKFLVEEWLTPEQLAEFEKPVTVVTEQPKEEEKKKTKAEQIELPLTKGADSDDLPF